VFFAFANCDWSESFNPATDYFKARFTSGLNPDGLWTYGYSTDLLLGRPVVQRFFGSRTVANERHGGVLIFITTKLTA